MNYVRLGKTNLQVAQISFGGIPIQRSDSANTRAVVDRLEALGINYIDTARGYTVSEPYLGEALVGRREKFVLATKSMARTAADMARDVDISLANLKTDYIDVYQLHNPGKKDIDTVFAPGGAYEALLAAQQAGKIRHIGVTAHNVDNLARLVDEFDDKISTVMFPYNIVENQGEDVLRRAKAKDIAVIAMKPLAGGNLEDYRLALRFIAASGLCDIAIPGMGSPEEVEKNAAICNELSPLTPEELAQAAQIRKDLGNNFCRRCGYCGPCEQGIDIPGNFLMVNYLRRYGLADWAKGRYDSMAKHASDCIQCGQCEPRCPYQLPIREMLKKVAVEFGK